MIIPTKEEITIINKKAEEIKNKINLILSKKDYANIISLLSEEENHQIITHNTEIYILYLCSKAMEKEMYSSVDKLLFEGRNVDEVIRLYRVLSLYLRRIEFDLPLEYQKEMVRYIINEKISIVSVVEIIKNNSIILQKEKVFDGFKKLICN